MFSAWFFWGGKHIFTRFAHKKYTLFNKIARRRRSCTKKLPKICEFAQQWRQKGKNWEKKLEKVIVQSPGPRSMGCTPPWDFEYGANVNLSEDMFNREYQPWIWIRCGYLTRHYIVSNIPLIQAGRILPLHLTCKKPEMTLLATYHSFMPVARYHWL